MGSCAQRRWIEALPVGSVFRSGEVPGRSRSAVHAFLSRETAKGPKAALCDRLGPDLYWKPTRDIYGCPQLPPFDEVMRKVAGPGFGVAGHAAGRAVGWLTHGGEELVGVAAVGSPPTTRPMPGFVIRRRSNQRRQELNPVEVAYLEAVRFFDTCAEVGWEEALRIAAATVEHHRTVRPDVLMWAARSERCDNAAQLRSRIAEVCDVVEGHLTPPARREPLPVWPGRPAVLEAAHLPALIQTGEDGRGRVVPVSQFIKDWAHWPDNRVAMCEREPTGPNRLDLVRIAATVHALCDRDAVAIPPWVWRHRWHEDILIYGGRPLNQRDRLNASPACEYHRVWFAQHHIMDYRVHGIWTGQVA